jgi:prolyl-tRNA editing enzyme YbaK/EbsC (Cys-tRNA(Pro) deacylase)
MNSSDLANYVNQQQIAAQIIHLQDETPTVAAAAEALGVLPDQIIKSVLFLADGRPVLVITNGLTRIHRKQLADTLKVSRRRVKMADEAQVLNTTGYPIGAVPPFGHLQPLETLLDGGVLQQDVVFGGGGEINALMRVSTAELRRATGGRVVDIADR